MKVIRSNSLAQCSASNSERERRSTTEVYFDKQVMETAIVDNLDELATVKLFISITDFQVFLTLKNRYTDNKYLHRFMSKAPHSVRLFWLPPTHLSVFGVVLNSKRLHKSIAIHSQLQM